MPRQVRIGFAGAFYRVVARGDRREGIFLVEGDRTLFWETVAEACGKTGWRVPANALMSNHYPIVMHCLAAGAGRTPAGIRQSLGEDRRRSRTPQSG